MEKIDGHYRFTDAERKAIKDQLVSHFDVKDIDAFLKDMEILCSRTKAFYRLNQAGSGTIIDNHIKHFNKSIKYLEEILKRGTYGDEPETVDDYILHGDGIEREMALRKREVKKAYIALGDAKIMLESAEKKLKIGAPDNKSKISFFTHVAMQYYYHFKTMPKNYKYGAFFGMLQKVSEIVFDKKQATFNESTINKVLTNLKTTLQTLSK